jgi:hypothetical protein
MTNSGEGKGDAPTNGRTPVPGASCVAAAEADRATLNPRIKRPLAARVRAGTTSPRRKASNAADHSDQEARAELP